MFTTFYSYKGGVGRSIALANVACLLVEDEEHPQKVLLWDFDLEAPGLHKLFPPKEPLRYGFVDLAYEFAEQARIPQVKDYIYSSVVAGIDILPAGDINDRYCDRLQLIDWPAFFSSNEPGPGPFFGPLIEAIRSLDYDYVLIDSRTGLNDQAGICTEILPELIVVLFRLTDQNLDGLEHLIPSIQSQLKARSKENVGIVPIASSVSSNSSRASHQCRDKALSVFGVQNLPYIRFDPELVSDEKLFCLKDHLKRMWPTPPIVEDYRNLCDTIRKRNPQDTRTRFEHIRSMMSAGDRVTAFAMLLPLLRRRPESAQLWRLLGQLKGEGSFLRQGNEVDILIEDVLRSDPTNSFAYEWRAKRQMEEARTVSDPILSKAKEDLLTAIGYCPDRPDLHSTLARLLSCLGDLEGSVQALRRNRELLPGNAQVALEIAKLQMRRGSNYFASAIDDLEAIASDTIADKYALLAYLRAFLGETDRAEVCFDRFKELERDAFRIELYRAHLHLIEGKTDLAQTLGNRALALPRTSESISKQVNWAEFFVCAELLETAIKLLDEVQAGCGGDNDVAAMLCLASYLKDGGGEADIERILNSWKLVDSWSFREFLFMRERAKLASNSVLVGRLKIIEDLIRQHEWRVISSRRSVLSSGVDVISVSQRVRHRSPPRPRRSPNTKGEKRYPL